MLVAAAKGHLHTAELLIERGADINHQDVEGWTPLMAAADSGKLAMVQWLVAHGAAASVRSRQGLDAAELAERRGHREVADWLRRAGK